MIEEHAVHVFWTLLDLPEDDRDRLLTLLSDTERERAGRFYFSRHRDDFIAAHGILRIILGRYAEIAPEKLCFRSDASGKPGLENEKAAGIRFNLSHSHGAALYGICLDRRIGVDIEQIRPLSNMESIAGRYFSKPESSAIRNASAPGRNELFFRYWTLKEAYIKATGAGLKHLRQVEFVSPAADSPQNKVEHLDASGESWSICPLSTLPGYSAALAVEGGARVQFCRQWTP